MKGEVKKVEVQAALILSRRELELLSFMCEAIHGSRNAEVVEKWLLSMVSGHYAGGVTKQELDDLTESIWRTTADLMHHIENGKNTLFGSAAQVRLP